MGQFKIASSKMKTLFIVLSFVALALSAPTPQVVGFYPYAGAPVLAYAPLESGLVYPVAAPYEHDPTGDSSDDSYPEALPYVHDTTSIWTPCIILQQLY